MCDPLIESPAWSLATVPTEILSHLCFFLKMDDILRLLATGSPLIIGKLRNQAVLECYDIIGTSNDGCAPPLARWRLDKVRQVHFSKIPILTLDLLDGLYKQNVFDRLETFVSDEVDLVEALLDPKLESWTNNFLAPSDGNVVLDLSCMLPVIKSLTMRCANRHGRFLVTSFPMSLESLTIENGLCQSLSTLPPHLTRLHLPETDILGAYAALLPPTLTSLATAFAPNVPYGLSWTVERSPIGSKISSEWFLLLNNDEFDTSVMSDQSSEAVEFYRSVWNRRMEQFGKLRRLKRLEHLAWQSYDHAAQSHDLTLPLQLKSLSCRLPGGYHECIQTAWYPPGLTSLKDNIVNKSKMYFSALPQGLRKLSGCLDFSSRGRQRRLKSLPPHLQDLRLTGYVHSVVDFECIPPHLTSLSLRWATISLEGLAKLPKTLLRLELLLKCEATQESELIPLLPPKLTKLKLLSPTSSPSWSFNIAFNLPSSIAEWTIGTIHCKDDFIQHVATSSPHLLKDITVNGLERSSFIYLSNSSYKKIRKFEFSFTNNILPFLYSNTEVFHDTIVRDLSDESFKDFTKLRIIELRSVENNNIYTTSILEHLPPSVTKIRIEGNTVVDDRAFMMIPKHLVELSVRKFVFTLSSVFTLFPCSMSVLNPENLRRCYTDALNSFGGRIKVEKSIDFDWASTAPELLRFPDSIKSIDLPQDCCGSAFWSTLPENLTFLKVEKVDRLSEDLVSCLPSSLTHLELVSENSLRSVSFSHLSKLESLILHSNTTLDDQSLSLLPKSLRTLNLNSHCSLRSSSVSLLPENLVELHIASSKLSSVSYQKLPRTLKLLDLSGDDSLAWGGDPSGLPPSLEQLLAPEEFLSKCSLVDFPNLVRATQQRGTFVQGTVTMKSLFDF